MGMTLSVYMDASHANDPITRRSTSFAVFLLGTKDGTRMNVTCAKTRMLPGASGSSSESEYKNGILVVQGIRYMRQLLADLGCPQVEPTDVFVDNTSAIRWMEDGKDHTRKRHIDIMFRGIEQALAMDEARVRWCKGPDQKGDFQTKIHAESEFVRQRNWFFEPLDKEESMD